MTRPTGASSAQPKMKPFHPRSSNAGFTLIEVLVSMLIIALGLLGLAGLQVRMQQAEFESYQRSQAVVLLYDMVERIQSNRATANCFRFTTDTTAGTPYVGTGANAPTGCAGGTTAADNAMADAAMAEWDSLLEGASEKSGVNSVGAMVGARGCVSYGGAATEVVNPVGGTIAGTGIYTVTVVWQAAADSAAPTVNCGNGLYGAETKRRAVSTTFRMAELN